MTLGGEGGWGGGGWSWWLYVKSSVLVHVKMVYRKYNSLYVTVCVVFMVLIE